MKLIVFSIFQLFLIETLRSQCPDDGLSIQTRFDTSATKLIVSTPSVYPNPTTGEVTVAYTSNQPLRQHWLSVFDVVGKTVLLSSNAISTIANSFKVNLHGLSPGTYFINITEGRKSKQVKIILINNPN